MINLPDFARLLLMRLSGCALIIAVSIVGLLSVTGVADATTDTRPKPSKPWEPNVLVLIMSGIGPSDQVSFNYDTDIPKARAREDLETWARETKLPVVNGKITTEATSAPGSKPTTSSLFYTQGVVQPASGVLPIEPYILTLKRFKHIEISYVQVPQMQFRGLEDFKNEFVKIMMTRAGNSYTYRVTIKDGSFDRLNLPLTNVQAEERGSAPVPVAARVTLILGLALLAAVAAYFGTSYLIKKRKA